jgi:serine/threonine-protein kinase
MNENISDTSSLLSNRYQLQQKIGIGGMATVYLARDLMLERPVAIKLLKQDLSNNPAFRKRFQQEARAAANLSHPNIVTVHDFGFHKGRLFIVMEYLPGQNLKEIIRETGKFSIEEALRIVIPACAGIGYAHRAGLVHCDIKPHNILVTPDQRVKVTDFGIARALSTIQPDEHSDVVWGSPQYFSPEQASGLAPSPASDVYSLGVILYEMLTGRLPFISEDPAELARMHREEIPTPLRQIDRSIPVELEQIILKVLSKEPSSRYRTTDQLGRILDTFLHRNENPEIEKPAPIRANTTPEPSYTPSPSTINKVSPPTLYEDDFEESENRFVPFDWLTILLGLTAVIALGGLIPFWIFVWFTINAGR